VTYFLTGATGFLGGALVRQLTAAGHIVRALVRDPARAATLNGPGIELHRGDVTGKETMRAPMTGVDGVFHVAGWYKIGVHDPGAAVGVNVHGTRHVLELMRELGVRKGVYTSTLAVNSDTHGAIVDETYRFTGKHISVYDRTKAEAHRIAEQFVAGGLPLVIVQPGLIYGPGDTSGVRTMLLDFLRGRLHVIPTAAAYSWGHVEDVARGHVLAMERGRPGRNYFLAGPAHTIVEAIDIASSVTGLAKPRRLHPRVLQAAAGVTRIIEMAIRVPPPLSSESLRVLAGVTYLGSSARAGEELGWTARPLADGLAATLRHEQRLLAQQRRT
jgi:nucleoside-diphosphate-sugar epimerase